MSSREEKALKSLGFNVGTPGSLIHQIKDQHAQTINKGIVRDEQITRRGRSTSWDRLQGTLTENPFMAKSLAGLGIRKGDSDYAKEDDNGDNFGAKYAKPDNSMHGDHAEMEAGHDKAEVVDSVHGADEEENAAVKIGKKIRTQSTQLSDPRKQDRKPTTATMNPVARPTHKSLTQDELFLKALDGIGKSESKKGALVDWAKEEEAEPEHKKKKQVEKGLFYAKNMVDAKGEYEPSKSDLLSQLGWKLRELQELKGSSWMIEQDVPEAKELAEKLYSKLKGEVSRIVKEYSSAKKSFAQVDEVIVDLHKSFVEVESKLRPARKAVRKSETVGDIVDSLIEVVADPNDPEVMANIHENSNFGQRAVEPTIKSSSKVPFLKSAGPGGFIFDFGGRTGNPLADNATQLLMENADPQQLQIAKDQQRASNHALTNWVNKGEQAFSGQSQNPGVHDAWAAQMNKPMDQQVREAHESGALTDSAPSAVNKFNKSEGVVNGQRVVASSETDAAVLEMYKAEMAAMNSGDLGFIADARNGGAVSVTIDAVTGTAN